MAIRLQERKQEVVIDLNPPLQMVPHINSDIDHCDGIEVTHMHLQFNPALFDIKTDNFRASQGIRT